MESENLTDGVKETQCLNSDIISNLPENMIENILSLMPIRDALRTSVLSKQWRYSWRNMPKLAFKDETVTSPATKNRLCNAIFHVLSIHNGPTILEFKCLTSYLRLESEFAQMISHLATRNNVKELIFFSFYRFKLPVSFFSLQGLECIHLRNCTFEPPLTFNGFSRLKSMTFWNVVVSSQALERFLSKCPLEHLVLVKNHL
ncbi:F-box/FBD/LRR-repeat protein At1g13570-like [Bidens hawaiensis]|uniref:F-box/FBD/LRR-repeat protein At1g13570-like n=1 Tax=Bidens hawaiensis TaxID=980011 RepID=UPI0040493AD8